MVRARQHVNPLISRFKMPSTVLWDKVFDKQRPLHLDIGCAHGRFALQLAQKRPDLNILGMEIRTPLVEYALAERDARLGFPSNLHYTIGNINIQIDHMFKKLPSGVIGSVSILHPDPWFRKKHHKRRVVNPEFVEALGKRMASGSPVYVQTDVDELMDAMATDFRGSDLFQDSGTYSEPTLGIPSEREQFVLGEGGKVYKHLFVRKEATPS